jgi:hypothetical protein
LGGRRCSAAVKLTGGDGVAGDRRPSDWSRSWRVLIYARCIKSPVDPIAGSPGDPISATRFRRSAIGFRQPDLQSAPREREGPRSADFDSICRSGGRLDSRPRSADFDAICRSAVCRFQVRRQPDFAGRSDCERILCPRSGVGKGGCGRMTGQRLLVLISPRTFASTSECLAHSVLRAHSSQNLLTPSILPYSSAMTLTGVLASIPVTQLAYRCSACLNLASAFLIFTSASLTSASHVSSASSVSLTLASASLSFASASLTFASSFGSTCNSPHASLILFAHSSYGDSGFINTDLHATDSRRSLDL